MTFPISSSFEVSSPTHIFESFDVKICRVVYAASYEDFKTFLEKGLNPNYTLESEVVFNDIIFPKGASLIFIIIQCCTFTNKPWELWAMQGLLLERGVDLKKKVPDPREGRE